MGQAVSKKRIGLQARVGLEQAYWVGSDGFGSWVCYIRAVGKKTLIFSFLSLSTFSLEREALFSLMLLLSSPIGEWWSEGIPARWPASYRGGATESELRSPFF